MNIRGAATSLSAMSNPIRICSLGDDTMSSKSYFITGLADYDVVVHVSYRVPTDATETHSYHASIDGLPGYEARGATELGAAEALCGRLIADLTKPPDPSDVRSGPEMLLLHLADSERSRHFVKGYKYGSPDSIDSIARQEA